MKQTFRYLIILLAVLTGILTCRAEKAEYEHFYKERIQASGEHTVFKYGLLSPDGNNRLTEPIFDKVTPFAPNGIAMVCINRHYGYIDTLGNYIVNVYLVDARPFDKYGLAAVKQKNKWGLINSKRGIVLGLSFDKIEKFQSNGLAIVKYENKYGLVDTLGNVVLPIIYDKIENFDKNGYAYIKNDNKIGVVDKRGRAIVPPDYKDKKSAMAAVSVARPKFKTLSEASLAANSRNTSFETTPNDDGDEKARQEEEHELLAEKARQEEEQKLLAEKARQEEEQRLLAEKARQEEEQKLIAEKARQEEEQKLLAEKARQEEEQKLLAEKARQEEEQKLLAEKARQEEEQKLLAEKARQEEEQKLLAEKARKEEEQKLLAEKARQEEEQRKAEARKQLEATPTLRNYILANLGEWNDYLAAQDLKLPSDAEISNYIESVVAEWQVKGEFEPTAKWKERVNETTRTAKINALADSIYNVNSGKVETVRAEYKKKYEALADKYCAGIAEQFASQTLELKPYDADNETFLISTNDFGDFLLPVPLDEAPDFKKRWEQLKDNVLASFVPNGEDVALKTVTIDKYVYDSDMNANYAQVDVEYNFKPVDISSLNRRLDANEDLAMNVSNSTEGARNQNIQTEKIKISAGNTPETDINIPKTGITQNNTFAVVIANSDYAHASKVMHAENDGRVMAQYLNQTLGIPQENIATFINATYGQMASAITILQDIGDVYKGTDFNILFYYVGHGLPDDEGKKSYILPVDIDPRHVSICMPLEKIYADLGNIGAKNVTVMVDACFSGSNHGEGMLIPQSMGVVLKAKKAAPVGNMVVLTAADGNETAFPYEEKGHGLFTYWVLKKLQETSGNVTLGDLSDYVIDNVKKTSVVVNRKPQTPTISTSPQLSGNWRGLKFGFNQ